MDQFNEIKKSYTQKNRQGRCLSLKANFEVSFLQHYKKSLYQCSVMAGVLLLTLQSGLVQGADRAGPADGESHEESVFTKKRLPGGERVAPDIATDKEEGEQPLAHNLCKPLSFTPETERFILEYLVTVDHEKLHRSVVERLRLKTTIHMPMPDLAVFAVALAMIEDAETREAVAILAPPLFRRDMSISQKYAISVALAMIEDAETREAVAGLVPDLLGEGISSPDILLSVITILAMIEDAETREAVAGLVPSLLQQDTPWQDIVSAITTGLANIQDAETRAAVTGLLPSLLQQDTP